MLSQAINIVNKKIFLVKNQHIEIRLITMCVAMEQPIFDVFSCTYDNPTPKKNNGIIDNICSALNTRKNLMSQ